MPQKATAAQIDRATGALLGVAIGDALGMPSQTLAPDEIKTHYGAITSFVEPFEGHPVSHGLRAAMITDDTEQTLLLAQRLIADPEFFNAEIWAKALLDWEASVKERGLFDLLGPSTKRSLEALLKGVPVDQTGRKGTTNGGAMRISPVGIATPVEPMALFIDQIEMTCRLTHNTAEAIASAAAVAATVSAGVDGASFDQAVPLALAAAEEGGKRGFMRGKVDMAARINFALDIAANDPKNLAKECGTSVASSESVATAFGVVRIAQNDPWQAAILSANIGDDTDTIGAIATGMAGSCAGAAVLPDAIVSEVTKANGLDLAPLVTDLLRIRDQRRPSSQSSDK